MDLGLDLAKYTGHAYAVLVQNSFCTANEHQSRGVEPVSEATL